LCWTDGFDARQDPRGIGCGEVEVDVLAFRYVEDLQWVFHRSLMPQQQGHGLLCQAADTVRKKECVGDYEGTDKDFVIQLGTIRCGTWVLMQG
jgi:hypothetical protein